MTYQATADLTADAEFAARLSACLTTEARGKTDALSDLLLKFPPSWGAGVFGPIVATAPGFADKYTAGGQSAITDGDLLSAVQASWDRVAALQAPAP